jgi:hypothetical protein
MPLGVATHRQRVTINHVAPLKADAVLEQIVDEELQVMIAHEWKALQAKLKAKMRWKRMSMVKPTAADGVAPKDGSMFNTIKKKKAPLILPNLPAKPSLNQGITGTDLLSPYTIMEPSMLEYYKVIFNRVHAAEGHNLVNPRGANAINITGMSEALKLLHKELINDKQIEYTVRVLDIMEDAGGDGFFAAADADGDGTLSLEECRAKGMTEEIFNQIDVDGSGDIDMEEFRTWIAATGGKALRLISFEQFAAIAALAERVSSLDWTVKNAIDSMDFDALHAKMMKSKDLFFLNELDEKGNITFDSLEISLKAGRMDPQKLAVLQDKMAAEGTDSLSFLDFCSYIPLFVDIHDAITEDALTEEQREPMNMFTIFRAKRALNQWKRKAHFKKVARETTNAAIGAYNGGKGGDDSDDEQDVAISAADVLAWKSLPEDPIKASHTLIGFGGGVIRSLLGKSRMMVEREPGSDTFNIVVPPLQKSHASEAQMNNLTLLVMTTKAGLGKIDLDESQKEKIELKSTFGRGPVFNNITIVPRVMFIGFTLSFDPIERTLVLQTNKEGDAPIQWEAMDAHAGGQEGATDLQSVLDTSLKIRNMKAKQGEAASSVWRDQMERDRAQATKVAQEKETVERATAAANASDEIAAAAMQARAELELCKVIVFD